LSNQEEVNRWEISDAAHGRRLDQVLVELSGFTRARVQQLINDGEVGLLLPNQEVKVISKSSHKVLAADVYTARVPALQPLLLEPENIPLDILFEDEYLIVVNKPSGMVVHPSHGHDSGTLVHALLHHCDSLPGINGVERPGIVHRLDKDTSGSLVVAKTEAAHHGLSALFASHDLQREYLAWCRGFPRWHNKTISLPMGRHPNNRQKMAVVESGKHAITDASLEKRFGEMFSRMRLRLHTGRTHQIRVHLTHEGLPILGDPMYGRKFNPSKDLPEVLRENLLHLSRQALHAEVLGFVHPITQEDVLCKAPLPDELVQLEQALSTLI